MKTVAVFVKQFGPILGILFIMSNGSYCTSQNTDGSFVETETSSEKENSHNERSLNLSSLLTPVSAKLINVREKFLHLLVQGKAKPVLHFQVNVAYETEKPVTLLPPTPPRSDEASIVCKMPSDLVLLIDRSGSVGSTGFNISLQFAAALASAWRKHNGNRVSVYFFNRYVTPWIHLNTSEFMSSSEIERKIMGAAYVKKKASRTPIHLALNAAAKEFKKYGRKHMTQSYVILTDGHMSNSTALEDATERLLSQDNVHGYAVGVGKVEKQQLMVMTGKEASHVYEITEREEIMQVLEQISARLCQNDDSRRKDEQML